METREEAINRVSKVITGEGLNLDEALSINERSHWLAWGDEVELTEAEVETAYQMALETEAKQSEYAARLNGRSIISCPTRMHAFIDAYRLAESSGRVVEVLRSGVVVATVKPSGFISWAQ